MAANPADGTAGPITLDWGLGDRLRRVRRHVAMSQAELANALGTNQRTYASWEAGQSNPRNLVAIAQMVERVSGVAATWVLGMEDGPRNLRAVPEDESTNQWYLTSQDATILPFPQLRDPRHAATTVPPRRPAASPGRPGNAREVA